MCKTHVSLPPTSSPTLRLPALQAEVDFTSTRHELESVNIIIINIITPSLIPHDQTNHVHAVA